MFNIREKFFERPASVTQSYPSLSEFARLSKEMCAEAGKTDSQYSRRDAFSLIVDAEILGLVSVSAMNNSGMFKNGSGMALDHVAKRAQRAINIMNNPNGYTQPKRSLYGDNNGIPTPQA
ncbi:MAG: hypothetical protein HY370_07370 [Proteobacteria bacterium]|nr:hypothetical protein [Pseudomonadota bacterium]